MRTYLIRYNRATGKTDAECSKPPKMVAFNELIKEISPHLNEGKGYILSDLRNRCNELLQEDPSSFNNREIKLLLSEHYGEDISFSTPQEANKSPVVFLQKFSRDDMICGS